MAGISDYAGKRVIVSGCFSGMGEATARALVGLGAEVHGMDFKPSAVDLASFTLVDLRDPASIETAVSKIGGPVDALFNCAGVALSAAPLDVMKVNFLGTRHLTGLVVPLMKPGSAIASISSASGIGWMKRIPLLMELVTTRDFAAGLSWCESHLDVVKDGYSLSKETIIAWTMLTGHRLIEQGIRINCTMPGPTQTPMMIEIENAVPAAILDGTAKPINRRALPVEQAYPLIFLNSDEASYINSVALPVDGGFAGSIFTGQLDLEKIVADAYKTAAS